MSRHNREEKPTNDPKAKLVNEIRKEREQREMLDAMQRGGTGDLCQCAWPVTDFNCPRKTCDRCKKPQY